MAQVDAVDRETHLALAHHEMSVQAALGELLAHVARFEAEIQKVIDPAVTTGISELRVERILRLVTELPVRLDLPGLVHEAGLLREARAKRRAFEEWSPPII